MEFQKYTRPEVIVVTRKRIGEIEQILTGPGEPTGAFAARCRISDCKWWSPEKGENAAYEALQQHYREQHGS